MADLSHIRQQGTLLVDHRGIVLPDARKWTTEYWQQSSTDVITIPGTLLSLSNTQSQVRRVAAESSAIHFYARTQNGVHTYYIPTMRCTCSYLCYVSYIHHIHTSCSAKKEEANKH